MHELSENLVHAGHKVDVLTVQPVYRVIEQKKIPELIEEDSLRVIRVEIPKIRTNSLYIRGINTIRSSYFLFHGSRKYLKNRYDAIITYAPPINFGLTAKKLKKKKAAFFFLLLRDIFPQNAIDLGILHNSFVIRYFEGVEKKVYESADRIFAQSEENKEFLVLNKTIPDSKIEVQYNWVDLAKFDRPQKIDFRQEFELKDKKVVLFAGTIGPAQGLENLLRLAESFKEYPEIVFLIVGRGRVKNDLILKAKESKLTNIVFKDFVTPDLYPDLVRSVDCGLIMLSLNNHTPIVPGKIIGYMAGKLPFVALLNAESTDTMRIIDQSQSGKYLAHDDIQGIKEMIYRIIYDESTHDKLGKNGRIYAEKCFSVKNVVTKIENELTWSLNNRANNEN
jgi:glycosyltransferase involved in cell wall biosynthesis